MALYSSFGWLARTTYRPMGGFVTEIALLQCILWPRFQFQIAKGDCTFPSSPVYILEAEAWDISAFLWIGYYAAEHFGRRGLRVKAFSVSVSMCALYSSVCVYASVSYGCFPPVQGVEMYASSMWMRLCVQHLGQVQFLILLDSDGGAVLAEVFVEKVFVNHLTLWSCQSDANKTLPLPVSACLAP